MSRIVIVEDDQAVAAGLAMNLRHEGFKVRHAADGPDGLRESLDPGTGLVILDIMLPGMNGYEVTQELRRRGSRVPVMMLSAKSEETDKIAGLNIGADDYMTKPFVLGELLARVKALLRRSQTARIVRFGEIEVDVDSTRVTRNGERVMITPQEFRLLRCLMENEGRALSREQLLQRAWGLEYGGAERTVDSFMRQLRAKLEIDPQNPKHLVTVRELGYRFER